MNFLHTFLPQPLALQIGPLVIHWYGVFMVLALLAGLFVSIKIARLYGVAKAVIYDIFFYLTIAGFFGARLFYILYNPVYFWRNPLDIFKIWQGGVAIHGALLFGLITLMWFAWRRPSIETEQCLVSAVKHKFWLLAAIITPGLALGQAIGRFGNYFNQELFGLPTSAPWGIPIALINRPAGFESFSYFHPAFLYESIGSLMIFGILFWWHWLIIKKGSKLSDSNCQLIAFSYLLLYSFLRFLIEFLRIDPTAGSIGGARATQVLSLVMMLGVTGYLIFLRRHGKLQTFLRQGDITKL